MQSDGRNPKMSLCIIYQLFIRNVRNCFIVRVPRSICIQFAPDICQLYERCSYTCHVKYFRSNFLCTHLNLNFRWDTVLTSTKNAAAFRSYIVSFCWRQIRQYHAENGNGRLLVGPCSHNFYFFFLFIGGI